MSNNAPRRPSRVNRKSLGLEPGLKPVRRIKAKSKRISRPGRRAYVSAENLPRVQRGLGVAVVSTSRGLLPDREARQQGVGGEVVCILW